jgi:hypothetical protein
MSWQLDIHRVHEAQHAEFCERLEMAHSLVRHPRGSQAQGSKFRQALQIDQVVITELYAG